MTSPYICILAIATSFSYLCDCGVVSQPNILFIVVDDLRPSLGSYGYPNVVTPNTDQLASHSIRFTRAFTQQAICGPSRTSFLTSRRPETTKIFANVGSYWRSSPGNFTTLPQHFKDNGYHTVSVGKIFHPGKLSGKTDDYPFSWSQLPFHPSTQQYKNEKACPGPGGQLYKNLVCPVNVSEQPEGTLPDIQSAQFAIEFLQNRSQNDPQQETPFFLAVGFHKPHIPLKYPEEYLKLYPLSEIHLAKDHTLPPKLPTVAWNPWEDLRMRDDVKRLNVSFPYGPLPSDFQLLIRQSYYAATTYMDDLLGKLLSTLDELGLSDSTIISFVGDHGWSLGEHQEWSKFSNFEVAVRVPLMMYVPGVTSPKLPPGKHFPYINPFHKHSLPIGRQSSVTSKRTTVNMTQKHSLVGTSVRNDYFPGNTSDALVELVDLFPTLSELAGLTVPQICPKNSTRVIFCSEGLSFAPVIGDAFGGVSKQTLRWKTAAFSQYPRPSVQPEEISDQPHLRDIRIMGYSMRTAQYRYTEWVKYDPQHFTRDWSVVYGRELYDHVSDPTEDNNLAGESHYSGLLSRLSSLLHAGWRNALPQTI